MSSAAEGGNESLAVRVTTDFPRGTLFTTLGYRLDSEGRVVQVLQLQGGMTARLKTSF